MKISIVGTGMFGFSIANHLGKKHIENNKISIMAYDSNKDIIINLRNNRRHLYHFKDKVLPPNISFTTDKKEIANNADIIVIAVTSKAVREVTREIKPYLKNNIVVLNTAKALERETAKIFSEVVEEELNDTSIEFDIAKMSGGTFAEDIINGSPLGVDIACENLSVQKKLQDIFHNENLRVYGNNDLIGVEYAGAFKNVIAIFAGIINGLGLPYGSETHMISRAAKEAKDIAIYLGAESHTFSMESQCWGNDLWMSCTGKSRNREFGRLIGAGFSPEEAIKKLQASHKLVEGYYTVEAIPRLCKKINVETPIFKEIHNIVYEHKKPMDSIIYLMKKEVDGYDR